MPNELPKLGSEFWGSWRDLGFVEIGTAVANAFFGEDVPEDTLHSIVAGTLEFDAPVITLDKNDHILELFHGPTLAFKDFGARFMARLMAYLTQDEDQELTVLVATSGDTGGAVASAFYNVPGTRVAILYPKGKVSGLQEKQLTALGGNITALEVEGTFDDCQALVKQAFLNQEISKRLNLTFPLRAAPEKPVDRPRPRKIKKSISLCQRDLMARNFSRRKSFRASQRRLTNSMRNINVPLEF